MCHLWIPYLNGSSFFHLAARRLGVSRYPSFLDMFGRLNLMVSMGVDELCPINGLYNISYQMVDKHDIISSISELSPINVPNYISIPSSLRLVLCPPHCACNDVNHFCPHLIRHVGVFHLGLRGLNYHSSSAICNNLPNKLKNKHAVCHQKRTTQYLCTPTISLRPI